MFLIHYFAMYEWGIKINSKSHKKQYIMYTAFGTSGVDNPWKKKDYKSNTIRIWLFFRKKTCFIYKNNIISAYLFSFSF